MLQGEVKASLFAGKYVRFISIHQDKPDLLLSKTNTKWHSDPEIRVTSGN